MENKTVFKTGQDVYCGLFKQWGKVVKVTTCEIFPIGVVFGEISEFYTTDGKFHTDVIPTLSFKEYGIEGVDQTPPRKPYEVGDVVYDNIFEGPGKVVGIDSRGSYPVIVDSKTSFGRSYTLCGKSYLEHSLPTLSYTEYNLTSGGFS